MKGELLYNKDYYLWKHTREIQLDAIDSFIDYLDAFYLVDEEFSISKLEEIYREFRSKVLGEMEI